MPTLFLKSFNFVIFTRLKVMVVKKHMRMILLHELKLGLSTTQTTRNVVEAWGEGNTSERTMRHWLEKFRSEDRILEDEEGRGHVI